jgi:hypothetical protein
VHDTARDAATHLPESIRKLADPVPQQGLATAATTVAGAVSQSAHRAVEHNYGKEADGVAQGQYISHIR